MKMSRRISVSLMRALVGRLLSQVALLIGRSRPFTFEEWDEENADAPHCGPGPMRFNLSWLCKMWRVYGVGAVVYIVLHEAAHKCDCKHLKDHSWEIEFHADKQASYWMALLGYSLDGVFEYLIYECTDASESHPAGYDRAEECEDGYELGLAKLEQIERAKAIRAFPSQWSSGLSSSYSWR